MNKEKTIVSMTTYPARVASAAIAMSSILVQITPDMNVTPVVVLAEDEWESKEVPTELKPLLPNIEILWVKESLKPYNKFLPIMEKYPDCNIITIDDDKYYCYGGIETFLRDHETWPNDILWGRGCEYMMFDDLNDLTFVKLVGKETPLGEPVKVMKPYFGVSGTFYPAKVFKDPKFYDKEAIKKYDLTCDDSWVFAFALAGNIPMRRVSKLLYDFNINANQNNALFKHNSQHYKEIWKNLREYVPGLNEALEEIRIISRDSKIQ